MSGQGFIKLQRSTDAEDLVRDPRAFQLLTLIALRARYLPEPSLEGLTFGQALIGDCAAFGMTPKAYRCAKARLEKWGLASFQGTPHGTVATILDSRVYSIRDERKSPKWGEPKGELFSEEESQNGASPRTSLGQARGELGATKKKERREEGKNMNGPQADFPPVPFPAPIDTEPFKAAWKDWQDYAKARRLRKWVPQTVTAKLAELAALGEAAAIAAIQRSISSGWQSIHPDTRPGHAQASTQPLFR